MRAFGLIDVMYCCLMNTPLSDANTRKIPKQKSELPTSCSIHIPSERHLKPRTLSYPFPVLIEEPRYRTQTHSNEGE